MNLQVNSELKQMDYLLNNVLKDKCYDKIRKKDEKL